MSTKVVIKIFIYLAAAVLVYLFMNMIIVTEKERVVNTLRRAKRMVENEDKDVLALFSTDFHYRDLQYGDLRTNLGSFFDRFDRIRIEIGDLDVSVGDTIANCGLKARVTAWADSMPVLLFGKVLARSPVQVIFTKYGQRWLIRRIDAD